jgi:hypothetical protein
MLCVYIYQDMRDIISLTSLCSLASCYFVDHRAQLTQQIGSEDRSARTQRDNQFALANVRPLDGQRAETPFRAQIGDAVFIPVLTDHKDFETLSFQRMERVCDGENLCVTVVTVCNAPFSTRAVSRT